MKSRLFTSVLISLPLCVSAQASSGHAAMVATSMPIDLNLLACHATLAGLTALGMFMSLRGWPWFRRAAIRGN